MEICDPQAFADNRPICILEFVFYSFPCSNSRQAADLSPPIVFPTYAPPLSSPQLFPVQKLHVGKTFIPFRRALARKLSPPTHTLYVVQNRVDAIARSHEVAVHGVDEVRVLNAGRLIALTLVLVEFEVPRPKHLRLASLKARFGITCHIRSSHLGGSREFTALVQIYLQPVILHD